MQPLRASGSRVVIIGAILLSARRAANNKRNVEPRGRNGHFVFTRSTRFRPKPGAIVGATANSPAAPGKSVAPSASPTPGTEQIIDSLGEGDLQAAIALLKSNFTNPDAITDTELNRAS